MSTLRETGADQPLIWDDGTRYARQIAGRAIGAGMQELWRGFRRVVGREPRR